MNLEDIKKFYNYFKTNLPIEIRVFDAEKYPKGKSIFVKNEEEFVIAIQNYYNEKVDVYIGGRERTGTSDEDVTSSNFIFLEIDEHDINKPTEIIKLEEFLKLHNIEIGLKGFSGGGYHYYLPHQKIMFDSPETREKYKNFLICFRDALIENNIDIDSKTFNLSRVSRVIGSYNFKRDKLSKILYTNQQINSTENFKNMETLAIKYKKEPSQFVTPIQNITSPTYLHHQNFWNKFLTERFPEGDINSVLEKNFAIWCVRNNFPIPWETIRNAYKNMNWQINPLEKYISNIQNQKYWSKDKNGNPKNPEYNPIELKIWCKKNHIESLEEELLTPTEQLNYTQNKDLAQFLTVDSKDPAKLELLDMDYFDNLSDEEEYIVKDFIYPGTLMMFYSPPKIGKSILSDALGMCISEGIDWLGLPTTKSGVLLCDKENSPKRILKPRFRGLRNGLELPLSLPNFHIVRSGLFGLSFLQQLLYVIEQHQIKLIIFDTLRRFADFKEDKSDDVNQVYQAYLQPILEKGVAIVMIHHSKKDGGYRGSSDIFAMVDDAYELSKFTTKNEDTKFKISSTGGRSGGCEDIIGELQFIKTLDGHLETIKLTRLDSEPKEVTNYHYISDKIMEFAPQDKSFKREEMEFLLNAANISFTLKSLRLAFEKLVFFKKLKLDGKKYVVVHVLSDTTNANKQTKLL